MKTIFDLTTKEIEENYTEKYGLLWIKQTSKLQLWKKLLPVIREIEGR